MYMISSEGPNVSANEGKSYLKEGEQPPGAQRISELLQALKLWGQKHTEEEATTGQLSFYVLISRNKCTISSQSYRLQIYF